MCRLEKSRRWAMRMIHELKMTPDRKACFITLTYRDEELPPNGSLVKRDWQLFAKRLRNRCGPFRFYMCGEYGDQTGRPHYHAIIFGLDFSQDRKRWRKSKHGDFLDRSATLEKCWTKGSAEIGEVTFESCAYVARYVMKKRTGAQAKWHYMFEQPNGDMIEHMPEFALMSRNPGLGAGYVEKYAEEMFRHDNVMVNGKACSLPDYYDNRLKRIDEGRVERMKESRRKRGDEKAHDNTRARLRAKAKVAEAKIRTLVRGL